MLSAVVAAAGVVCKPDPTSKPSLGRGLSHAAGMRTLFYQIVGVRGDHQLLVGGDGGYLDFRIRR